MSSVATTLNHFPVRAGRMGQLPDIIIKTERRATPQRRTREKKTETSEHQT